ncbi:hypothetical protein cce_3241 [Crocosphaera subtropica ATCC 51142]|uniref:Uncharacterized protein n=1 Tax=Crocosphaera subtropica (strain ATCC 51142 / BH68) TaxID=43989 RepID=B1WXP8_CROS5|nr:hypothetical protein cce_3241 [Crocosphaera subtropica ATCC 51142]
MRSYSVIPLYNVIDKRQKWFRHTPRSQYMGSIFTFPSRSLADGS